jgi:hypothetical protein
MTVCIPDRNESRKPATQRFPLLTPEGRPRSYCGASACPRQAGGRPLGVSLGAEGLCSSGVLYCRGFGDYFVILWVCSSPVGSDGTTQHGAFGHPLVDVLV